ncbi:hypothetical protein [Terribacillus sp. FSL K6-0262]|uniref:hypothetical protein n=1 Tax=unclassified Terribacillus TaxID=2636508 RepID=UPI0030ECCF3E
MKPIIKPIPKEMTWKIRHLVLWPDKHLDYVILEHDDAGQHYGLFINDKLVPSSLYSLRKMKPNSGSLPRCRKNRASDTAVCC